MPFVPRFRFLLIPSIFLLGVYLGSSLEPTSTPLPEPIYSGPKWTGDDTTYSSLPPISSAPASSDLPIGDSESGPIHVEIGDSLPSLDLIAPSTPSIKDPHHFDEIWFDFGDSPFPPSSSLSPISSTSSSSSTIDGSPFLSHQGHLYFHPSSPRIDIIVPKASHHLREGESGPTEEELKTQAKLRHRLLEGDKKKRPRYPGGEWRQGMSWMKRNARSGRRDDGEGLEEDRRSSEGGEGEGERDGDGGEGHDEDEEQILRDAHGNPLAPHAAEMIRAKREGRPFRPAKPWQIEELQRELQEKERQKREEEEGSTWDEGNEEEGGGEEGEEAQGQDLEESRDDEELGADEDQKAILEALKAISPEDRTFLSEEEQALVKKIEEEDREQREARAEAKKLKLQKEREEAMPQWAAKQQQMIRDKYLAKFDDAPKQEAEKRRRVKRSFEYEEGTELEVEETPAQAAEEKESTSTNAAQPQDEGVDDIVVKSSLDADRPHPIKYLIAEAERKWKAMLRGQSQTLDHAVYEYKKRYGRNPPLGFDSWWRYAMENRVILVDEYDQINCDLEPLFSLSPDELRQRAESIIYHDDLPLQQHTFSLAIQSGEIERFGLQEESYRAYEAQDLLASFIDMMPDVTLTFSGHDEPLIPISGEAREQHVEYARQGKVLDRAQSYDVMENTGVGPWQGLCAPNSTARRLAASLPVDSTPAAPSFVSMDHLSAMDMCLHPEMQYKNGFTAWDGPRPYLLYPVLSWSKMPMHGDLLVPSIDGFSTEFIDNVAWEKKKDQRILWRGSTTGLYHEKGSPWRLSQRARLVRLANEVEGARTIHVAAPESSDSVRHFIGPSRDVNDYYFDISYAGAPTQCDERDGTCDTLKREYRFTPRMSEKEGAQYKYVFDVDGNGPSKRFRSLLSSRSAVLKSTMFPEWWTKRLVPWYHYIPVKSDYSDLRDIAGFFIGAADGSHSHDALGKKIAGQGRSWVEKHWRKEDIAAYQFRLYLEVARLLNRNSEGSHDFRLN